MSYTSHVITDVNEAKTKSSNISFCIEKLENLY